MYGVHPVLIVILMILITVLGLRALVSSDDETGRFAGAALVAIAVTTFALLVASR